MGSPNFGRMNANKSFEVLMGWSVEYKKCSECGEKHTENEYTLETLTECENGCENPTFTEGTDYEQPEYGECENFRAEVRLELEKLPYSTRTSNRGRDEIGLTKLIEYKSFGDVEVAVGVDCFMEIGYHEGGRLDWELFFEVDNSEYEDEINLSQIKSEFEYSSDLRVGLQVILSKKVLTWMEKMKEEMIKAVEEIYEQNS